MTNARIDSLGTAIANATMLAASEILKAEGRASTVDLDALVIALRREAKTVTAAILDDGRALLDSGNPGWLDAMLKTHCVAAACRAVGSL